MVTIKRAVKGNVYQMITVVLLDAISRADIPQLDTVVRRCGD
jgi:hypothetical protein